MIKSEYSRGSLNQKLNENNVDNLESLIKSNINNKKILEKLYNKKETIDTILYILSKNKRTERDIYILNFCLKMQKNFLELFKFEGDYFIDEEELLTKISYCLKSNIIESQNFLFKVGNKGFKFYIILKGKVSVLVPKTIKINMNEEQYIDYLNFLYSTNEKYLLEKTLKNNFKIYNIPEEKISNKRINVFNSQGKLIIPIEEYIQYTNGEKFINESSKFGEEIIIEGYVKITELNEGNSFGGIALLSENSKRTASIFFDENCVFGILKGKDYQLTIKQIHQIIKRHYITFILNFKLFQDISVPYFSNNYWNFFKKIILKKNDYLFKEGNKSNEIYFVHNGEIEIKTKLNFKRINILISYFGKSKLKKKDIINKGEDEIVTLSIAKNGDLLGLNDNLFKDIFFCDAIVYSEQSEVFSIEKNLLENIWKNYNNHNFTKIQSLKEKLILNRLINIKITFLNDMIGEFRDKNENCITLGKNNYSIHQLFKRNEVKTNNYSICKMNLISLNKNNIKGKLFKRKIGDKKKYSLKFNYSEKYKKIKITNPNSNNKKILNLSQKNSLNSSFSNKKNSSKNSIIKINNLTTNNNKSRNNTSFGNYSIDKKIIKRKINPRNYKKLIGNKTNYKEKEENSLSDFVSQMNYSKNKSGSFYNYVDCLIMEKSKSKEKTLKSYHYRAKSNLNKNIKNCIPINFMVHAKPLKIVKGRKIKI